MDKLDVLGLSLTLALILPGAYAGAANEIRGKVISITLTNDCPTARACQANVDLAANDGEIVTFHVRPDTRIQRGGKPILPAQLAVGNVVSIPEYDEITPAMRTLKQTITVD